MYTIVYDFYVQFCKILGGGEGGGAAKKILKGIICL